MSTQLLPLKPKPVTKWGEFCFFLSVSNLIFSTWILSVAPWNYWMYHIIKNVVYIFSKYVASKEKKWQYFLIDFCYTVNYWSFLYFLLCPLKANLSFLSVLRVVDQFGPAIFRIAFAWSTGVLATSIAVFSNAMVFHSTEHMSILAVHIGPPLVVWAMRWYASELQTAWPDTFHTGCLASDPASCTATFGELVYVPAIAYLLMWTVPYSLLIFIVHEKKIKADNYVTMFSYYEKSIFPTNWNSQRLKQFLYMGVHATLCCASFLWSYVLWHNFYLHTLYLVVLLHVSIYNGATYYFRVCMNPDKLLKQRQAAADSEMPKANSKKD